MAIGIGTRVRVTHKPEHDHAAYGRFASLRDASSGAIGFVEGHSPDGDLLVGIDGAGATWWHPDEVTAAPIFAETCESLRDELANEKAAHAEAERLLSAERAALEVSRAKVLDLEMRAVEAERLLTEAREQRQQSLTAASRAAGEIIEARDRLSRVKAAVDALRAAWFPISGEDAARYRDHMGAIERALAGVVSAPTSTFTFGRFVSGHVQRLRDGTWEWCHDGGFDHGVIDLAPDVCAFLSSVAGPPRPVLTEDRAREMAEEAIEASMNRSTVVLRDNMAALLLRVSRGDFGETASRASDAADDAVMTVAEQDAERARVGEALTVPADIGGRTVATRVEAPPGKRWAYDEQCEEWCLVSTEPAVEQPRTDLAALADAIEANGRTWQRVEPSTVAQALRAVDRRMGTLEAAVNALAASVEQAQAKAGIGEPRVVDCEGGVNGPMRGRRPDPQQGDGSGRLVLGHIDGQPIRARYTGVTPTEPRKP